MTPPVTVDPKKAETKKEVTKKEETKKEETKQPEVKDETADTFTGTIRNGFPDGYGTYTFRQSRRIDMHDPEQRVAQKGDYIVGDWNNGHLNYGEWYGANGVKKGFIELGDNADDISPASRAPADVRGPAGRIFIQPACRYRFGRRAFPA